MNIKKSLLSGLLITTGLLSSAFAITCPTETAVKAVGFQHIKVHEVISSAYTVDTFGTDLAWELSTFIPTTDTKNPQQELAQLNKLINNLHFFDQRDMGNGVTYCFYHYADGEREALLINKPG
ncbi:MAG: hypothetical protein P1U40_06515 [Coxiellaceae bacterium]|nr:hypothetical protein [Coxiellaceae bacterium]